MTKAQPCGKTVQLSVMLVLLWTSIGLLGSILNLPFLVWLPFIIQWLVAFPSIWLWNTERYYDLSGGVTYWTLALVSLSAPLLSSGTLELTNRQILITFAILCWSTKLSFFLFRRIQRDAVDLRFDTAKTNTVLFFLYWNIQALWVLLTLLPVLLLNHVSSVGPTAISLDSTAISLDPTTAIGSWSIRERRNSPLTLVDFISLGIWTLGFIVETVADHQKTRFRELQKTHQNNSTTHSRRPWITSGLWYYSQHPNYFGEMCCWWGIYGLCVGDPLMVLPLQLVGLLSPITVMILLCGVSGIPMLDKLAKEKGWTDMPAYQSYCAQTNVLIPWFPQQPLDE